jgi:hypothetical protein
MQRPTLEGRGRARARSTRIVLLWVTALALAACGGAPNPAPAGPTGSVAITLTDAPSDDFAEVNLTLAGVELLGPDGPLEVWNGLETVNLLDLETVSELFAVAPDVPAARYARLALTVSDIELVHHDGSVTRPDLPPRGRVLIDPGVDLEVEAQRTLLVEIDVDVEKSLVVLPGRVLFRPLVLVHALHGGFPGRLVRIHGRVQRIDAAEERLVVCRTHVALRPLFALSVGQPVHHRCVDVALGEDGSVFDRNGEPTDLASLSEGDPVTSVGRFHHERLRDGRGLEFVAAVMLVGEPGSFTRIRGWVDSPVDDEGRFDLEVGPGEPFVEGTLLAVQLQEGTKLFSWPGIPLGVEDVEPGLRARVVGVLQLSDVDPDQINAAWVRLEFVPPDREVLRGTIEEVADGGGRLVISTGDGSVCADLPAGTPVFLITTGPDGSSSERIPRGALVAGLETDVYAVEGPDACWIAHTVIAFDEVDEEVE